MKAQIWKMDKDEIVISGPLRRVVNKHASPIHPGTGTDQQVHDPTGGAGGEEPESLEHDEVGRRLFFHGTLRENLASIAKDGLVPQVGDWVEEVYIEQDRSQFHDDPEVESPEPLIFLSGPRMYMPTPEEAEEFGLEEPQTAYEGTEQAMAAITEVMAQTQISNGGDWRWSNKDMWPSWEELRENALIVIVDSAEARDSNIQLTGYEGSYTHPIEIGPDWVEVDPSNYNKVKHLGPEEGDYVTSSSVKPTAYLYGDNFMRWFAQWVVDHQTGGSAAGDDKIATMRADDWFNKYEYEIYEELYPPEENEDFDE